MKKLISIALCLCMIFAVACMTAGCGNEEVLKRMDDLQAALQTQNGKIDELQNQNTNLTEKLEDMKTQNSQLTEKLDEIQTQNTQLADKLEEQQAVIDSQTAMIDFLKEKTLKGTFLTLREAYKYDFLTIEDVKSIAYYYNVSKNRDGRYANEEIMPEDYSPIPKKPESLSFEQEFEIRQNFWNKYVNDKENTPLEEVGIGNSYYGTYNNCVAVMVWVTGPYSDVMGGSIIDGVNIIYPNNNSILIWVKE